MTRRERRRERIRLKRTLQRHGITQAQVARACGVTRSMVTKVLGGAAVSRKVMDAAFQILVQAKRRGSTAA